MLLSPVKVGHLQGVEGGGEGCERRDAHPGEVDGPELHLFDDGLFLAELLAVVDLDLDPAPGALLNEAGEFHVALGGGVIRHVGFAQTEHHLRSRRRRKGRGHYRKNRKNHKEPFHPISSFKFRNRNLSHCTRLIPKTQSETGCE